MFSKKEKEVKRPTSCGAVEGNHEPNLRKFVTKEEEGFRTCTRVLLAPGKVGSYYHGSEFRRDASKLLESLVNCPVHCCCQPCDRPKFELLLTTM